MTTRQFSSFCTYLLAAFQRLGMRADDVVPDAAGSGSVHGSPGGGGDQRRGGD
ncbi:hypothetical protein ACU4HD_10470 [Cupriavidus basilensis]